MDFNKYFNTSLRDAVEYPEKFTIISSEGSITLNPDQESYLLKLIKSSSDMRDVILRVVSNNLKKEDPTVYNLYFSSHGKDIVINFQSRMITIQLDTGIHSIIASYLNEIGLDRYCKLSPIFEKVCVKPEFWVNLIRVRYPEYFVEMKGGYSWEKVYRGLLYYDDTKRSFEKFNVPVGDVNFRRRKYEMEEYNLELLKSIYTKYPEAFLYLLYNSKLNLTRDQMAHIFPLIDDISVIKYILNKYENEIDEFILYDSWNKHIWDIEISKLFLKYHGKDSVEIDNESIRKTLESLLLRDKHALTVDEFQLYFNRLYPSGDADDLISLLLLGNKFNSETLDYVSILLEHEDIPRDLYNFMTEAIENGNVEIIELLWENYREQLLPRINDLKLLVDIQFGLDTYGVYRNGETYDEILEILR
jgi:hypothetical protein